KRAVSAGAPVSAAILGKLKPCIHPQGDIFTPYGATEALPVASISAGEVLGETVFRTNKGGGVCVGRRFLSIEWKVIKITDALIERLEFAEEVPLGEIGELAVTGAQVTKMYVNRPQANAAAKMLDSANRIWHRMGDVGYLDEQDRFWFCGRKAHRVVRGNDVLFTIPCEAVFNQHAAIYRSALTGSPQGSGARIFVEPLPEHYPKTEEQRKKLIAELLELGRANPLTESIAEIRILKHFPVDVRHNVKINRELLAKLT
ncbi:MAG: AMP-binding protein, partial [Planctomycetaceae bacterium]|nr:AMP-binding protein [Planctomycetaceae bacterium]